MLGCFSIIMYMHGAKYGIIKRISLITMPHITSEKSYKYYKIKK